MDIVKACSMLSKVRKRHHHLEIVGGNVATGESARLGRSWCQRCESRCGTWIHMYYPCSGRSRCTTIICHPAFFASHCSYRCPRWSGMVVFDIPGDIVRHWRQERVRLWQVVYLLVLKKPRWEQFYTKVEKIQDLSWYGLSRCNATGIQRPIFPGCRGWYQKLVPEGIEVVYPTRDCYLRSWPKISVVCVRGMGYYWCSYCQRSAKGKDDGEDIECGSPWKSSIILHYSLITVRSHSSVFNWTN